MHLVQRGISWFLLLAITVSLLEPSRAQENPSAVITGQVFDSTNGQPVRNATAEIGSLGRRAAVDTDGRYRLTVPPGVYTVKISAPNYHPALLDGVRAQLNETVEASTVLALTSSVVTVEVSESVSAVESTAASVLAERKLAPVVSDSLSKEDLRANPGSDAAAALERVIGVSVLDGGYVYVRGLGERYSATLLNNSAIPTTEPERRVVPLDLFPSLLIDSIKVLKTYSPDLPGEFSGGMVQMSTVEFPAVKTLRVTLNYGFNTQTSLNRFRSYRGGSRDWAGADDGSRRLPAIIPRDQRLFTGSFSEPQFQQFGRSFAPNYEFEPIASMRPSQTYSVVGGNSWGRLGLVGAVTFSNSPQHLPELRRFLVNAGGGRAQVFSDYPTFESDNESVRLGALLNAALRLGPNHKLIVRNILTRDSDKESRFFMGLNGGDNNFVQSSRLRWIERSLLSTGMEGVHSAPSLRNSLFRWQFSYSGSGRSEPDLREVIYGRPPEGGALSFLNLPDSGLRFFSDLSDRIYEPQGDWSIPFYKGAFSGMFKAGLRATVRRRNFESRRFRFFPVRASTINFSVSPNQLLGPANLRPDGFVLREITRATDSYDASMNIYGGYAMADLALGKRWRLISGLRIEDAGILVKTLDPLVPGGIPSLASLANRDALPSLNVIYTLTGKQNLRFGYGRTVNRPDFRELSPFEFTNIVGGYSTVGNPDLQRAVIDNFDVRWEWFPGGSQVLAASFFRKRFTNPIEQIYRPTASELRQSFLNVAGAMNQGAEVEIRRNLGVLSRSLASLNVQANLTIVDSDVRIPTDRFPQLTSRHRPLVGQSRFIYNLITDWVRPAWRSNFRFYANSVSRRITDVGTFRLPDVYQERTTFLDLVYNFTFDEKGKWSLRLSAENLSNNHYRYSQAGFLVRAFRVGRTFTIGTSYSFF